MPHFLWALKDPFPTPWVRTRRLLLVLFLSTLITLTSKFQDTLGSGWDVLEEKNGKLTASLVVLWILVFFPNVPPTIYFSESSNSHSKHSVQVLQLYSVGKTGWSVLTPSYLEPEPGLLFFIMNFVELINYLNYLYNFDYKLKIENKYIL